MPHLEVESEVGFFQGTMGLGLLQIDLSKFLFRRSAKKKGDAMTQYEDEPIDLPDLESDETNDRVINGENKIK